MATHFSVLAWRIPGMGEPSGLPSMGLHRVGHNWNDLAAAAAALQEEKSCRDGWYIIICMHLKPLNCIFKNGYDGKFSMYILSQFKKKLEKIFFNSHRSYCLKQWNTHPFAHYWGSMIPFQCLSQLSPSRHQNKNQAVCSACALLCMPPFWGSAHHASPLLILANFCVDSFTNMQTPQVNL